MMANTFMAHGIRFLGILISYAVLILDLRNTSYSHVIDLVSKLLNLYPSIDTDSGIGNIINSLDENIEYYTSNILLSAMQSAMHWVNRMLGCLPLQG